MPGSNCSPQSLSHFVITSISIKYWHKRVGFMRGEAGFLWNFLWQITTQEEEVKHFLMITMFAEDAADLQRSDDRSLPRPCLNKLSTVLMDSGEDAGLSTWPNLQPLKPSKQPLTCSEAASPTQLPTLLTLPKKRYTIPLPSGHRTGTATTWDVHLLNYPSLIPRSLSRRDLIWLYYGGHPGDCAINQNRRWKVWAASQQSCEMNWEAAEVLLLRDRERIRHTSNEAHTLKGSASLFVRLEEMRFMARLISPARPAFVFPPQTRRQKHLESDAQ